jgi:hypothetical protein
MTGDDYDDSAAAAVKDARGEAAVAVARLAEAAVRYADTRTAEDTAAAALSGSPRRQGRAKPGEFVADEVALVLREQPDTIRCLLARSRRLAAGLPTVWAAFRRGELDSEQIRVIDRAARKATETATLAVIDEQVVEAAQTRTQLEPAAFEERHGRALADGGSPWCKARTGWAMSPAKSPPLMLPPSTPCWLLSPAAWAGRIPEPSSNAAPTCLPTCCWAGSATTNPTTTIRTKTVNLTTPTVNPAASPRVTPRAPTPNPVRTVRAGLRLGRVRNRPRGR